MEQDYYSYIRKMFHRLSYVYDLIDLFIMDIRTEVVDLTNAKEGAKILDVATGTGKQAFAFGKRGYEVVGIDLSEHMLKVAERNNEYNNVGFILADAAKLPFIDQHFDVGCISFALHEMPLSIRKQVLQEIVRVTRIGGTIMINDYSSSSEKRAGGYFVRYIARLYESKYYAEFIQSDLNSLLKGYGIEVTAERSAMHGVVRILKCIRR